MIDKINREKALHILTIEDPIEYVHFHNKSLITQREVGMDTESFEVALRNTLRQAPDVILIGEIRTREAMEHAIAFAETGHLAISTLHANNANQALDRIIQNVGATAILWPYKTDCCGASQVLSRPDIVSQLVGKLYDMAQRVGAQAIVVSCQMCQANLDMH